MKYQTAPAMINGAFTKYYDFFVDAFFVGKLLQKKTVSLINLKESKSLVDIGCGTGTLVIFLKEKYPQANITGVDPDLIVLGVARKKAQKKKLTINFIQSGAERLPFSNKSIDVATSSLAFHHMPLEIKKQALSEIKRVLKNNGIFYLVDIGKPKTLFWKVLCRLESIVEPKEYLKDNLDGKIPMLLKAAGFTVEDARDQYMGIYFWKATKI